MPSTFVMVIRTRLWSIRVVGDFCPASCFTDAWSTHSSTTTSLAEALTKFYAELLSWKVGQAMPDILVFERE